MILFYGEGRLGNQVFQYRALNCIARTGESVTAVGLEDIESILDLRGAPIRVLTRNGLCKRAIKYLLLPLILRPLSRRLRLINYAYEPSSGSVEHGGQSGELRFQRGLLDCVTFVDGGSYQSADTIRSVFPIDSLQLRTELGAEARRVIARLTPAGSVPVAVHVRRGDYLTFSCYGVGDLTLPESFFRSAVDEVTRRHDRVHFIFVTDDPEWVSRTFADLTDKSTVSSSAALDFAVISECRGAVLSNSTFSLAAALLLRAPLIVIGPEYWFGFRVRRWLPPRIRIDNPKLLYLPVLSDPSPP